MTDIGILGHDLGDIVGLMAAMLTQPEEVEHTDQAVLAVYGGAAVGVGGGSAQGVNGHEGAARDLLLVVCHRETPFGGQNPYFSQGLPCTYIIPVSALFVNAFSGICTKNLRKDGQNSSKYFVQKGLTKVGEYAIIVTL
jgi:hypothetical protein